MTRRPHRPAQHPLPGRDLTWSHTALPPIPIPGAAIAAPGTVADDLRSFQVGVVRRRNGGYEAYVKFCASFPEICVHGVSATSGAEAKALGIAEHVRVCVQGGTR